MKKLLFPIVLLFLAIVPASADILSPTDGSTLDGSTQVFTWQNTNAEFYAFWFGSTVGGDQHGRSGVVTGTSHTKSGLPTNGSTVFVRFFEKHNNVWDLGTDTTYIAAGGGGGGAGTTGPWIATGQTAIAPNASIDNPAPSNPGAVGQVTSLPYTVPSGCSLTIDAMGMEGYVQSGISVLFVWTGTGTTAQWRLDHASASVAANAGSQEITGQSLKFPAGTVINIRVTNGSGNIGSAVFGWYVNGSQNC